MILCRAVIATVLIGAATPAVSAVLAPLYNDKRPFAIEQQFIVVFQKDASETQIEAAADEVRKAAGDILKRYFVALHGFSASVPLARASEVRTAIRALPGVASVEVDQVAKAQLVEKNPPDGLDRVDQRLLPLDKRYTFTEKGSGVNVYVIDSGIFVSHGDFSGRASGAFTAINDGYGMDDRAGHGTHVAGTIGGTKFGVAKDVHLFAVRVLDQNGQGDVSNILAGIDWVAGNAVHPAVANMSIEIDPSPTVDLAVKNSIAVGITYVVAAGNEGSDACGTSPADVFEAITVGASLSMLSPLQDARASFSNFGPCVDLFAPGLDIESSWIGSKKATKKRSGTSMAAAHVSGVAALFLQTHASASPVEVWIAIHNADSVPGIQGWNGLSNPGAGSPNELLHWGSLNNGTNEGDGSTSQSKRSGAPRRRRISPRQ